MNSCSLSLPYQGDSDATDPEAVSARGHFSVTHLSTTREPFPGSYKWLVALELLVNDMRQRECSQKKDKILAPLAFAINFATANERTLRQDIDVILDYQFSTEELYCRSTKFMINSMNNLDILSRTDRQNDAPDRLSFKLPSWVSSFHTPGVSSFIDGILWNKFDAAKHLGNHKSTGS